MCRRLTRPNDVTLTDLFVFEFQDPNMSLHGRYHVRPSRQRLGEMNKRNILNRLPETESLLDGPFTEYLRG